LKIFGIKSQLIYCHHGGITYLSMALISSMFSRENRMRRLIVEDTWYSAAQFRNVPFVCNACYPLYITAYV